MKPSRAICLLCGLLLTGDSAHEWSHHETITAEGMRPRDSVLPPLEHTHVEYSPDFWQPTTTMVVTTSSGVVMSSTATRGRSA